MEGLDDLLAKHKGSKSNDNYEANGSTMLQPSLSVNLFTSKSTKKELTLDRSLQLTDLLMLWSIPGNTIAVNADMPFSGLTTFGGSFLSKFECSQMPHTLLEHITFVDTLGVLSGEKQRTQRSYDFTGVISWFAHPCEDHNHLSFECPFSERMWTCIKGFIIMSKLCLGCMGWQQSTFLGGCCLDWQTVLDPSSFGAGCFRGNGC